MTWESGRASEIVCMGPVMTARGGPPPPRRNRGNEHEVADGVGRATSGHDRAQGDADRDEAGQADQEPAHETEGVLGRPQPVDGGAHDDHCGRGERAQHGAHEQLGGDEEASAEP